MQPAVQEEKKSIVTICYGNERTWNNRSDAVEFFLECMLVSDGSERERYKHILESLFHGDNICSDDNQNTGLIMTSKIIK